MTDREVINLLIDAWEVLPGGWQHPNDVASWLEKSMAPAINKARKAVGRKQPKRD